MNIGSESAATPEHMMDYNHKLLPLMKTWLTKTKKWLLLLLGQLQIVTKKRNQVNFFFRIINLFRSLNFASKRFEENVDIDNQRWEIYVSLWKKQILKSEKT